MQIEWTMGTGGFAVFLPADGTATYNRDFHAASLRNLSHGAAAITLCSKMMEPEQK